MPASNVTLTAQWTAISGPTISSGPTGNSSSVLLTFNKNISNASPSSGSSSISGSTVTIAFSPSLSNGTMININVTATDGSTNSFSITYRNPGQGWQ
ncbi:MAG: hypothetical protein D5S00_04665 [Tindallia sp. MSAO_Bac2]|nr:MAG: hypothetical protein D5S00_04665 [Tindallia sp. MSAO_Bac2]